MPSNRAHVREQYEDALRQAVTNGQALIVELEPGEKHMTVRNRLKRAGEMLRLEQMVMRRRGDRIVVYVDPTVEARDLGSTIEASAHPS